MAAAATIHAESGPRLRRRFNRLVPYLLLAPGLAWLGLFYVIPAVQMFTYSLSTGNLENGFEFTGSPDAYGEAIGRFSRQFVNSVVYGGAATILTFVIGFPVAYTIAFRGGAGENPHLFLLLPPIFTRFLL